MLGVQGRIRDESTTVSDRTTDSEPTTEVGRSAGTNSASGAIGDVEVGGRGLDRLTDEGEERQ
jgi:hypothetical protein